MKSTYENFIGVYDNAFTDKFCDDLILYFAWCKKNNRTFGRQENESIKKDDASCLNPGTTESISFSHPNIENFVGEFNDVFWNTCYKEYLEKYSVLSEYSQHTIYTYKIQKTVPSGGYHVWHSEHGNMQFAGRTGVYLLYLNDVDEGGETEFLYLSKRITPKKGRLLIFPPNYPWAHRGNPPLSGEKYILTGWMEFS